MSSTGRSMTGPCAGSARSGSRARTRSSDARYRLRSPPRVAGMTTVPPCTSRSRRETVRSPACHNDDVVWRVARRGDDFERSIPGLDHVPIGKRQEVPIELFVAATPPHFAKAGVRPACRQHGDALDVITVRVRDDDGRQRERFSRQRGLECLEMRGLTGTCVDERGIPPADQPRPVALTRIRPGIARRNHLDTHRLT